MRARDEGCTGFILIIFVLPESFCTKGFFCLPRVIASATFFLLLCFLYFGTSCRSVSDFFFWCFDSLFEDRLGVDLPPIHTLWTRLKQIWMLLFALVTCTISIGRSLAEHMQTKHAKLLPHPDNLTDMWVNEALSLHSYLFPNAPAKNWSTSTGPE